MEKIWFQRYPAGVPHTIDVDSLTSIVEVFESSCKKFGAKPSFYNMGKCLTYEELDRLSAQFASYLQHEAGLKKGDRIALQMPNVLQYPVALFGALRAGLIVVNTNPLYTEREMAHQFKDSGAKAIVILSNFASKLEPILKDTEIETVIVSDLGDLLGFKGHIVNFMVKNVKKMVPPHHLPKAVSFKQALAKGAARPHTRIEHKLDDVAFLQYTGGTTGVSKGAVLTHGNIVANMEQMRPWFAGTLLESEELVVTPLPLYHIFALTVNCLLFIRLGGRNVLITNPRDIPAFVKEIKAYPVTVLTGVNTLFNALLSCEDFKTVDFKRLKVTVGGAMAVQSTVAEKWKQLTGGALVEGYGLTEASPVVSCNPISGGERIGTIGMPLPSTEIMLLDEDGNEVAQGEVGELCVRGPQVMQGYWQRQDETDKVIKNGWLHTGDMAMLEPDGFFRIVDRKKDMILVSGFNVYPNEVEDVIATHPKVLEVAVVGVPDARSGEAVKAYIVKRDATLTDEEILAHCREQLTAYKVPRTIEFRTELPKTNVGKILRRALRDEKTA